MPRTSRIIIWTLVSFLAVIAAFIIFILVFDWNRARPWINQRVSESTGRQFAIQGDLKLAWHQPDAPQSGWANWVPWPRLTAQDIVLGNPDWLNEPAQMAAIKQVTFTLNPLPLLAHKIVLPVLEIDTPQVFLLRDKDARNNWTFKSSDPSAWDFELQKLILKTGTLQFKDALQKVDIRADIDTLDPAKEKLYGIGWTVKGTFNNAPVSGGGKAGAVLALQNEKTPYPLEADVRVGQTRIAAKGTLTKPQQLAALDFRLSLSGNSMAHLYPLTGVLLPQTPPFATEGHLIGKLGKDQSDWIYEKFSGKVGSSDVGGTLEYQSKQPRPLLKGEVVSNLLRFEDLAPLIGAEVGS